MALTVRARLVPVSPSGTGNTLIRLKLPPLLLRVFARGHERPTQPGSVQVGDSHDRGEDRGRHRATQSGGTGAEGRSIARPACDSSKRALLNSQGRAVDNVIEGLVRVRGDTKPTSKGRRPVTLRAPQNHWLMTTATRAGFVIQKPIQLSPTATAAEAWTALAWATGHSMEQIAREWRARAG